MREVEVEQMRGFCYFYIWIAIFYHGISDFTFLKLLLKNLNFDYFYRGTSDFTFLTCSKKT